MIINSITNDKDPTLANLTLINGIKAGDHKRVGQALEIGADPNSTTEVKFLTLPTSIAVISNGMGDEIPVLLYLNCKHTI